MKIDDLKDFNKPINKLCKDGAQSLSNEELLAIIINAGTKDSSCIDIAQNILNSLNNLNDFLDLNISKLTKFKGIGMKKAATIVAAIELNKRCSSCFENREIITTKDKFYRIIKPRIVNLKVEHIFICYLDAKLRIINLEEIKGGSPNHILFPFRNIIKRALELDSVSVIIAHNHPSGDTMPSEDDINATEKLFVALRNVDINLLDHLVVARDDYFSIFEILEK